MTTTFRLGAVVDADGARGEELGYQADDLTTHGVIVGMTGSGKTGLGVVLLEEALRAGIPTLVLDPKGDMANLALRFPDLAPADFRPWVDEAQARREGVDVGALAERTAAEWRDGLASWGLSGAAVGALAAAADVTVYTPGSSAGVGLDVVGRLDVPALSWDTDAEALREEITGYVTGLLALAGVDADPVASREVALLATVIETAWREGRPLDLGALIAGVQQPPFRKLGVLDVDAFFPPADRTALAMRLNAVAASPSFAAWMQGAPVDIDRMLHGVDGRPRCAVVSLAHLAEGERQFVVTLVLSRLVTWMRAQPGTSALRVLAYMDEVAGYCPPSAVPPAKRPILTLLKQARAFGVGLVLATQNPVDLDYKALSNAGTWMVGRLQTERDKARLLAGMTGLDGGDAGGVDAAITRLAKRQFLLHRAGGGAPRTFTTRWAMSYLRGPMTREEIARLRAAAPVADGVARPATEAPAPSAVADDEVAVAPRVADKVRIAYLDPAAAWAPQVGAVPGGTRLEAAVAARVHLRFDDARAGVREHVEWEAVWFPLAERLDPAAALAVDHDERDLLPAAPAGARYVLPAAPVHTAAFFAGAATALEQHLVRSEHRTVLRNPVLKLYSRVDESEQDFLARCRQAADAAADAASEKLATRYTARIQREAKQVDAAALRVQQAEADLRSRRASELASGAGALLGVLLGGGSRSAGRRAVRSIGGVASRRGVSSRTAERLDVAEAKLADEQADVVALQEEVAAAIDAVHAEWADTAEQVEEVPIALSAADVVVDELLLVWVPTG